MAMFLLDLVFILEAVIVSTGLVILYFSRKESSKLLRASAIILLLAGLGTMACSLTYAFKYKCQGAFQTAYPTHQQLMGQ